jgi:hypothetical protein
MRRDEVARAVETGFAVLRVELSEPTPDGDVGADDENSVGVAGVPAILHLVQDAPCRDHRHDRGLPGARRHLAGVPLERAVAVLLLLPVARLVNGHLDALEVVATRVGQENDRLDSLVLCEEQALLAPLAPPVLEEFQRGACRARIPFRAPLADPRTDLVDEGQIHDRAGRILVVGRIAGHPVEVLGRPATGPLLGLLPLLQEPVKRRLHVGGADDRFGNLEFSHAPGHPCTGSIRRA